MTRPTSNRLIHTALHLAGMALIGSGLVLTFALLQCLFGD